MAAEKTIPLGYHNLNFSNFIVQPAGTAGLAKGVVPHSGNQYAANGPLSPGRPAFSVHGTNATSFDLKQFWYGCLLATEAGSKAGNGAQVGPSSFSFVPSSLTAAEMMLAMFGSAWTALKEARILVTASGATVPLNVFLADDVSYTVHGVK